MQKTGGPQGRVRDWLALISRWPVVAVMVAVTTVLGAAITLYDKVQEATERASSLLSVPEVVGLALSKNATGMVDTYHMALDDGPGYWEFAPDTVSGKPHVAIFTFTLSNPSKESVVFTEVLYDVLTAGVFRSQISGPLDPLTTYVHEIEPQIGTQRRKLSPPFIVAANSVASLDIQWVSLAEDANYGLGMKVGFVSRDHIAITPRFELALPRGRQPAG